MFLANESRLAVGWVVRKLRPPAYSAVLIAKGAYRLRPGAAAEPLPEPELFGDSFENDDLARELRYSSDFADFKPRADLLVYGHAHSRTPVKALRVSFRVGAYSKSLDVIGDRVWTSKMLASTISEPEPFTRMRLTYARAFGGPGFEKNPLGTGFGGGRLPNLESPDRPVRSLDDRPDPAGFGPLPMTWPQRASKLGTYDKKYMKERWPWFPEDFDASYFNAAPADQRLEGFLAGNETLRFDHLHPEHERYESKLPSQRVRCFLGDALGLRLRLREVEMRLDTLHADLDSEILTLVWRGHVEIGADRLDGTNALLVATETLSTPPRPLGTYAAILDDRIAAAQADPQEEIEEKEDEAPDQEEPPPDPPEEPEPAVEDPEKAEVERLLRAAGIEPPEDEPEEEPPAEEPEPEAEAAPAPEAWTREQCIERMRAGEPMSDLDLTGVDLSGIPCRSVNFRSSILTGSRFAGCDLTGAVFADAILEGADLSRATLQEADLENADLTGANLDAGDLRKTRLAGADLSNARLREADLRESDAADASFSGADLRKVRAQGARLAGAILDGAVLHDAGFEKADLTKASLHRAWGCRVRAGEAALDELRAVDANLPESDFRGASAGESVWEGANLYRADFRESNLRRAAFEGASLEQARLSKADLREADLSRVNLNGAEVHRANLLDAGLSKSTLRLADFSESNLFAADFFEADVTDAKFDRANLKRTLLNLP